MNRVLVTGSSGQLGAEVARQLLAAGSQVVGVDMIAGQYTTVRADIRDASAVMRAARNADALIHTASLHAPHVPTRSRREFVETNIGGTLNILEAASKAGIRRVVYTSTTSVYGGALTPWQQQAVWVTEDLIPDFARSGSLSVLCLRVCRFFPELPSLMATHRLYRGADVRDIAAAHVQSVAAPLTSEFELFNVAGPYAILPEDCAALWASAPPVIERRYPGTSAAFASRGWQLPDQIDRVYVSARARDRLGYQPRFGITEYLAAQKLPTTDTSPVSAECGG